MNKVLGTSIVLLLLCFVFLSKEFYALRKSLSKINSKHSINVGTASSNSNELVDLKKEILELNNLIKKDINTFNSDDKEYNDGIEELKNQMLVLNSNQLIISKKLDELNIKELKKDYELLSKQVKELSDKHNSKNKSNCKRKYSKRTRCKWKYPLYLAQCKLKNKVLHTKTNRKYKKEEYLDENVSEIIIEQEYQLKYKKCLNKKDFIKQCIKTI